MGKKKFRQSQPAPQKPVFDFENSPYYVPAVFGIMLLALVVLFGSFLFSDKMLYGSDMISAGVYHRGMLVDYFSENGKIPQWDPYVFGGMPYVEAFHGDIFYPFSVMKFFVPLYFHLGFNLILHIFFAGFFMYLAARQFALSKTAALFSAASYMFAHYLVSMIAPGHEGKIYVTALFPLVILFLERAFEKKPFFNFTVLGIIIGIIIVSPHPQMSYFTLWAVALYSLYKLILIFLKSRDLTKVIKPGLLVTYAVVIGLLLSAIQFYPGYVYTTNFSPRADTKKGWDWATSWSLHEEEAFSLLIPEFAGTSTRSARTVYWGKNVFKDNAESVGLIPLFLGLIGLFYSRRRERWFFGGLALFALIYGLGGTTPIFKLFYYIIPKVSSMRAASMIMFLFSFSFCLLAGMGVQHIIDAAAEKGKGPSKGFNRLLFGLPGLMLLLALLFSVNGQGMLSGWTALFFSEAAASGRLEAAYQNLPAIQSGAWMGFLFSAAAAACIWLYRTGRAGLGVMVALLAIPIVDGMRFDARFISVIDPQPRFASNPMIEFFKQQEGKFRVLNLNQSISATILPQHGVEVVTGYHGNQLRWYDDLLGGPGAPNQGNPRLLNLVGTKYVLMPPQRRLPDNYFGNKPVVEVPGWQGQIIRNDNAIERVFLVDRYRVFDDRKQIYPEILNGTEDLRRIVYLETEPQLNITSGIVSADSVGADSAWIIDHRIDSVLVGLSCRNNRILVLNENYYDAWKVFLDGQPAPLLRAYGTFRAVEVPAGTERVLFKYKSERYATGRLVTWLTALYLMVILGFYWWKAQRTKPPKEERT